MQTKEQKPLRATKVKLAHILHLRTRCSCQHGKEYHIGGRDHCVFGICDCKKFNEQAVLKSP